MAAINLIIADVFELSTAGKFRQPMIDRVKELYQECIDVANASLPAAQRHTFSVAVADKVKPSAGELDFIIYLLPIFMKSIVRKKNGMPPLDNLLADHWGFTMFHTVGTANSAETEIIHKSADGAALGSVIFHELLHYKTGKGNGQLHPTGGLGAATVTPSSKTNLANRTDVVSTITKKITPWLDGFDVCVSSRKLWESNKDLYEAGLLE